MPLGGQHICASTAETEGVPHEKRVHWSTVTCKSALQQSNCVHVQHTSGCMSQHRWQTPGNSAWCQGVQHCEIPRRYHDNGWRQETNKRNRNHVRWWTVWDVGQHMGLVRGSEKSLQETGELGIKKATSITKLQVGLLREYPRNRIVSSFLPKKTIWWTCGGQWPN